MKNNTKIETAQKSQAINKDKTPTGKVKTIKSAEERKKIREEQYRNFRINSLRRRCTRMGYSEEKTEEFVKKLIEQLNAPKEYTILVMFPKKNQAMIMESLANASLTYKFKGEGFFYMDGNQNVLAKIREIMPEGTKIHPYAKKMESVITEAPPNKEKKPTNNTPEKKAAAKKKRKIFSKNVRGMHKKHTLESVIKRRTKASKKPSGTVVQMTHKKLSKGLKKGSMKLKKAA